VVIGSEGVRREPSMAVVRRGVEWEKAGPASLTLREEVAYVLGKVGGLRSLLKVLLSIAIPIFILFRAFYGPTDAHLESGIFVGMVLCYVFLSSKSKGAMPVWRSIIDWTLFALSAAIAIYIVWSAGVYGNFTGFFTVEVFGINTPVDVFAGTIMLLLVLEANRRDMGWALLIFVGIFVAYIPLRPYLPGFLGGTPIQWDAYIAQMFAVGQGIYGQGTDVLISTVFLFLMFGAIMVESRVGAFFTSLANSLVGGQTGGAGKVTVVASGMLGAINASGLSEVVTTGPITIPMMKAAGFKPEDAAAIEVVASTGGSWTPPIMGAAAYLMAVYLKIPYAQLCLDVLPAAFLYFLAVFIGVHCKAKKEGLGGVPKAQLPATLRVLAEGWHLLIPVAIMVLLLILNYSVSRVGVAAVVGTLIFSFVKKETRMSPIRILSSLAEATRATTIVSTTMILVGVVIAVVDVTGIGLTLSMVVEKASGGSLIIGLLISAAVAFILGLPLPPLLVYLYGVIFMIPALIDLGANPLSAHLFFFWWGVIGTITPPVCVTAFAAAAIAGAPLMKTGWVTTKMAYVAYLLPFLMVFSPSLILQGVTWAHIPTLLVAVVGVVICTTGVEGYLFGTRSYRERLLIIASGAGMIFMPVWLPVGFVGIGLLALMVLIFRSQQRKKRGVAA
jgi:TRAP transporter 4TM/12TM fusion protein